MIPLLGVVARSGTGKTTLLKQVIPYLRQQGLRVGLIKHSHHTVDVDTPGKDSFELRKAGAEQTMVASSSRWALMTETPALPPLDLYYLASRFDASALDLILVEGFKYEKIDKIALFRQDSGKDLVGILDEYVVALATDIPLSLPVAQLDINNAAEVGDFIISWLKKRPSA